VSAAARKTCDRAFYSAHARKIALAIWTFVEVSACPALDREGEIMTALLVADSKIVASPLPLIAMWQDLATSSAELRENMGQFMT
jgi:hypothetical protein